MASEATAGCIGHRKVKWLPSQVVAYNKIDVADSGDYFEDVAELLARSGVARNQILPISAATGRGVVDLVRCARTMLDALPPQASAQWSGMPGKQAFGVAPDD